MFDQNPLISAELAALRKPETDPRHIVDVLIEERASHLMDRPRLWSLVKRFLYPQLKYPDAVAMADEYEGLTGHEIFKRLGERLQPELVVRGLEHVPTEGPVLLIGNHPTGIADGVVVTEAIRPVRDDLSFWANRDALRAAPGLIDTLIPVEWVMDKRSHGKTKVMLKLTHLALDQGRMVGIFPSGRVARLTFRGLQERPWMASTITLMRRFNVPILPMYMRGRNSALYYLFSFLHPELRDITLFNELLNKRGARFELTFGPLIQPEDLEGSPQEAIDRLRALVETDLKNIRETSS
ncbi:MAG: acyltransferase [Alphaproteobacteria bacterium]|nr:MAG: acyltransferase [Alphaproteobacteria bacterium]